MHWIFIIMFVYVISLFISVFLCFWSYRIETGKSPFDVALQDIFDWDMRPGISYIIFIPFVVVLIELVVVIFQKMELLDQRGRLRDIDIVEDTGKRIFMEKSIMKVYKLTDEKMQTYKGFQWELNKTYTTSGEGELCGPGFLHSYEHPLLAVLHNLLHADFDLDTARLFEAEASGTILKDNQLKMGSSQLTLTKEIPIPNITLEQRIKYGILCVREVCSDRDWNIWADKWLSGQDRSRSAAEAAAWSAAEAAEAAARAARSTARSAARSAARAAWSAVAAAEAAAWSAVGTAEAAAWSAAGTARSAEAADINLIQIAEKSMQ